MSKVVLPKTENKYCGIPRTIDEVMSEFIGMPDTEVTRAKIKNALDLWMTIRPNIDSYGTSN